MGQESENAALMPMTAREAPAAVPPARRPHPVRGFAFNALRFASVLIGAGLLLRTASAEYVASAPQEPSRQPDKQISPARVAEPARLALPEPSFGQHPAGGGHADTVPAARPAHHRHHAKPAELAVAALPANALEKGGDLSSPGRAPAAAKTLEQATPAATLAAPTSASVLAATSVPSVQTKARIGAPRSAAAAAGLLAPVKIVSGMPVARTPAPASAAAPVQPRAEPQRSAPQAVQISLAPPVMRPGPHTTALVSDVRAEMRRPASAWDYAEALPPELSGHPAAPQRQAAMQPIAPNPPAAAPAVSATAAPRIAQAAAPAPIAPVKAAAGVDATPVRVAPAPRPQGTTALLDRAPNPAPLPAQVAHRQVIAADARRAASRAAPQPVRSHAAPPPERDTADRRDLLRRSDSAASDTERADIAASDATAPLAGARVSMRSSAGEPALADASSAEGPGKSLRDMIPRPAF